MMTLATVPLGLLLLAGLCLSQHFGYDEDDGPSTWGEHFPTCLGKRQSPINIEERDVKNKKLPPLEICGYRKWHTMTIVNNGHTIMLKSNESSEDMPIVTGGPLGNNSYKFEQLHFHWGKDNSVGSETTINNKSFSMEAHFVFYKAEYKSLNEAVNHEDGLAVLGQMYEVHRFGRNKILDSIVEALPNVQTPDGKEKTIHKFRLSELLKPENPLYYTYDGSLTTPPCSEVVTWIVFKKPKYLSNDQLDAFRKMKTDEGTMTHNYRPVQPLWDRIVYRNIPNGRRSGQCRNKLPGIAVPTLMGFFLFVM